MALRTSRRGLLGPWTPASSDRNTPRRARVPRTPVGEHRLEKSPSPVPSAHSGFLSSYTCDIFEDADPPPGECGLSAGSPLPSEAWGEVALQAGADGDLGIHCGLPLPPPLPPVSPLYLHPASCSCPGLSVSSNKRGHLSLRLQMTPVTASSGRGPGARAAGGLSVLSHSATTAL